uniref:TIAM Rac1 associated GEF 2a n=1 Tax=Denticeps clupeoides TaxID=299321 RepID=A0AAY4CJR9_9TELE
MGNSESQYSIQRPRGTSIIFPGKQKPFLKFHSTKEETVSPYGLWKGRPGASVYKSRVASRGDLSQQRTIQPYASHHCDYIMQGPNSVGSEVLWNSSSGCMTSGAHLPSENGYQHEDSLGNGRMTAGDGYKENVHRTPRRNTALQSLEEQSSPRVVIKKDGSLRVEFTNTSNTLLLLDECAGPVQLLKFSPTLESTNSLSGVTHRYEHHLRPPLANSSTAQTSKESSLSSEGSWYDSPWGTGTELNNTDSPSSSKEPDNLTVSQLGEYDQPTDSFPQVYRDPAIAVTFNTTKDLPLRFADKMPIQHRDSIVSELEVPTEEDCPEPRQYSSFTLPCRKPRPVAESAEKKDSIRFRMRRLSDWTGSLTRKKRKLQEPKYKDTSEGFDSGVDGLTAETSSPSQVSSLLWYPRGSSQARPRSQVLCSRSGSAGALHVGADTLQQDIYENFMLELEAGCSGERGGARDNCREPSTEGTDESSSEEMLGSLDQLDLLFEKEQGVVRRAGWLSFKPLLTLHKDRKLELVGRRKWKHYWVTLKGCTLLFYETYGKSCPEQDMSPCYALLAEDSIVQAVPEHPKRENVFCLSNTYGDVYLFQATNQTDLENWVTAIHSASASLFAKRHGKEDTLRLLRGQIRGLLQKIDMDSKMRKMAELQLSIVNDPKNRKAIENQIQQWEQNLERFNMELFRMRCYLASLQGGELPNPKSLLATASRPSKSALGRLGIFSVSSFHALICSRDEATLRKRSLSLSQRGRSKRSLFSSLKGLDNLTKRGREKRPASSACRVIFLCPFCSTCLYVRSGLRPGDEILILNGQNVLSLDLGLIQKLFGEKTLHLTLRRDAPFHTRLSDSAPKVSHFLQRPHRAKSSSGYVDTVCTLYHSFQDGSSGLMEGQKEAPGPETTLLRPCPRHMSATERLRKVIQELVDTEKSYVKDLSCLFEIYLKPLQKETFLTMDEMESLFGSLPEMLEFQKVFLQTLEERIASSPNFSTLETPVQFKKLLFSLGGSFLYYADHFKLYSGFCANHIKVQKVLERAKTDWAFKEFLDARNPTKQHSTTLESYLIKPVQRVLKYPLLLRELVSLTDTDSEEHYHLTEALKAMEMVASHINEMQKIYEDYGSVFDQLVAEQSGTEKEVTEISMGEFQMHSTVIWLNPFPSLGRMRKDPELTVFVFKKAVILVCRENKPKKKMNAPRPGNSHADLDPFKFRWLVPLSQVRLGNSAGTETNCIWELVHTKSETEGRPETIFQLCSSVPESKVKIIKTIRSIVRENVRKNMRSDLPTERVGQEQLAPLRRTLPSSARIGSSRASWLCKRESLAVPHTDALRPRQSDSDEASLSSGTPSSGCPPTESPLQELPAPGRVTIVWQRSANLNSPAGPAKESDILSDEDEEFGDRDSSLSTVEDQLKQLSLTEGEVNEDGDTRTSEKQPARLQRNFSAVKRKSRGGSLRRSQVALLSAREYSHSLDGQSEMAASAVADLNSLLEREFSVQSLTSVVNEDCFYETAESGDSSTATTSS